MCAGHRTEGRVRATLLAAACALLALDEAIAEDWYDDDVPKHARGHTTMYRSTDNGYRIFKNMWYHNAKYFALVPDPATTTVSPYIGLNTPTVYFPTEDADEFIRNVEPAWLQGTTLAVDFVFPAYPDNHGHWTETLFPMIKAFSDGEWCNHVQGEGAGIPEFDRIFFLNVRVDDLSDWTKEALTVCLGADAPADLPVVMDQYDLKEISSLSWIGFENLVVATDRYTNTEAPGDPAAPEGAPLRTTPPGAPAARPAAAPVPGEFGAGCDAFEPADWPFALRGGDATEVFRKRSFRRARMPRQPLPSMRRPIPKQITFISAADGESVVNHDELALTLWEAAVPAGWRVRQFVASGAAPFSATASVMAATGLLVGRHGPLLASAALLPPGAAVYELLPFNWEWRSMAQLYRNLTRSTGHLHHFAWRPTDAKWAVYASEDDRHMYSAFKASECTSKKCLLVHARASLLVDVEAVKRDIEELLPRLEDPLDGCGNVTCRIENLCRAWPPAEPPQLDIA